MNRRYLAIATLLAPILLSGNGCASSSAQRQPSSGPQVAAAPQATSPRNAIAAKASPPAKSSGGILSEVEAPKIASATKFEDAPSAGESAQVRSMREQMARRYGCCGK